MIILGIDPGYAIVGYGVIEYKNNHFTVLDYGAVTTAAGMPFNERLEIIYNGITEIIEKYKPVKNNLDSLIESSRKFVDKHISKASSIKEKSYENIDNNIYSIVYNIKGNEVASPYQFFATDKNNHFLRGALYFNMQPNNDSLAPVIEFIEKDIDHLINTLKWK